VVFVPAGTVHALGPGTIVAEIQQNSDTTYRIYDWGRLGNDGQPRPLHIADALEVIDWEQTEPKLLAPQPTMSNPNGIGVEELAQCAYFHTQRVVMGGGRVYQGECAGESYEIWAVLSGAVRLEWAGGEMEISKISWVLLPASLGKYSITARSATMLLRVITP